MSSYTPEAYQAIALFCLYDHKLSVIALMNKIGIKHPLDTKTSLIIGFNFISKWPLKSAEEQWNWLKRDSSPLLSATVFRVVREKCHWERGEGIDEYV